jgi:hypothetical protein
MFIMLIYDGKGLQSAANNHITRKNKTCSFCHFFSLSVLDDEVELLLVHCLLASQFIHEVKLATMEGLFEFLGKRKESKLYKMS